MMRKRNKEIGAGGDDHNSESMGSGDHHDGEEVRRGPWTLEEDSLLTNYIVRHGEGRWNMLAKCAGLKRTGKSCRLRWLNYLKPDTKRGNLTSQEQLLILQLHSKWGNRWSKIAQHLPGRTDNEIKNYWRTRVQKQARLLNIDSTAHHDDTFLEAVKYLWTPRLLHKMQQTSSSSSNTAPTHSSFTDFDSQPTIPDDDNSPICLSSAPPPLMPNFAPTHQSLEAFAYSNSVLVDPQNGNCTAYNDLDFLDQVQLLQGPQLPHESPWNIVDAPHATANINHTSNYYSCNLGSSSNGYHDDEDQMFGNCTMASTSALQPYFDTSTDHQCCQMEKTELPYSDVANSTLWSMDDIWQIRQTDRQELINRSERGL